MLSEIDTSFRLLPDRASSVATEVDLLTLYILGVTVFFTLLIAALIVFFALKYRRRAGHTATPTGHNLALEITWTIIPMLIMLPMFAWGAKLFIHLSRPPENAMEMYVTGKQWMWKIQHPEGRKEINELHVPLGQPVKLTMTSEDVIHSFFIPAFRVKRDVIPGRYTSEWFEPTELGEYHIFCSQYCGRDHSRMVGKVTVMDPAKYQDWLAGAVPDLSSAAAGEKLFVTYGCLACHAAQAPTMAGLYGSKVAVTASGTKEVVTADDNYIRESILYPRAKIVEGYPENVMPSFVGRLDEEQVMQLIAYIKSLNDPHKPRPTPGPGGTTGQ